MKILLSGAGGTMGKVVRQVVSEQGSDTIVAGFDKIEDTDADFPIYADTALITEEADVLIDFSHPTALSAVLAVAVSRRLPTVIAATGYSDADLASIRLASEQTAILQAGNFSLGITLLTTLVRQMAAALPGFDIEIIERHHNKKVDAPSGTALMLLQAAKAGAGRDLVSKYGRSGRDAKRSADEIGIHAVRGGTIVGEHDVVFAGIDEVIEIRHSAGSKKIFAVGALRAANFLLGKAPGLYTLSDLFG